MNLQAQYNQLKQPGESFGIIFCKFLVALAVIAGVNWLWNFVAPTWGLPILTYKVFLASIFLVHMLRSLLGFNTVPIVPPVTYMTVDGGPKSGEEE